MPAPFFFGYGSLVNRKTHDYPQTRAACVQGWKRQWRHTSLRKVAYLSVAQSANHEIEGLIAAVPGGDWAALDERERAYDRLTLQARHVRHDHPDPITIEMYRTKPGNDAKPDTRHPILQSYLDTVALGYLDVFGTEGVRRFFNSTDGWDSPVLMDRADPVYPRAVLPDQRARGLIDAHLDRLNVTRI